jgi:hypothetical protein
VGKSFSERFKSLNENFDSRFASCFEGMHEKANFSPEEEEMGKQALSNLIGGIG